MIYCTWKIGNNGDFKDKMIVDVYDPKDWRHNKLQEAAHFSEHHRKVFIVTRHNDSRKRFFLDGLIADEEGALIRKLSFNEDRLKQVSNDPDIMGKASGPLPVPIIDCAGKDIDFTVKPVTVKSFRKDFNLVTGGTYTWGTASDYATLVAAFADVGATLTGNLTLNINSSVVTETARAFLQNVNFGGFQVTIGSTLPHAGDLTTCYQQEYNHASNGIVTAGLSNGTFEIKDLCCKSLLSAPAAAMWDLFGAIDTKIHDVYLDGNAGLPLAGLAAAPGGNTEVYNTLIWDIVGDGFLSRSATTIVNNCGMYNCGNGCDDSNKGATYENVWCLGCAIDFNRIGNATGNNCASSDATTDNFSAGSGSVKNKVTASEIITNDAASTFGQTRDSGTIYLLGNTSHLATIDMAGVTWDPATPSMGAFQIPGAPLGIIEWDIYLGTTDSTGKLSPFGRKVTIAKKETVFERRAADGTLKQDCMYVKREFILNYAYIAEAALEVIDSWYASYEASGVALPLYMYTSVIAFDEYLVIPKPVDRTRVVKGADNLYSGVKFVMIEV